MNTKTMQDFTRTTELLVEDIHFLRHKISPDSLKSKSVAINASNIAAIGGIPKDAYGKESRRGSYKYEKYQAISAPKSAYKFPGMTCISVEKAAAHGIPADYQIQDGDLINIDVSAHKDGFYSYNGESFVVGRGDKIKRKLTRVIKDAVYAGINEVRAGRKISFVGKAIENIEKKNNLSVIKNLGGHGVGSSLHEEPQFIASN